MSQPPAKASSRSAASQGTREDEKKGHSKPKDLSHVPCKFFRAGQCTAGSACPFSHTAAEPGQPKQVCQWFLSGNCRFAHKCALAHIHPGEPMSMDRKNKKAAQQAMQQQQGQEGGTSSTAIATPGKERDRNQQQNRRDRERDRDKDKDKERTGKRDRTSGGTRTGSRPPRDRTSDRRRDSTSTAQGDETSSVNGAGSSVATMRLPIRIGKGPTTSASVTAPPVLRDTSATATMASPKTSNESEGSFTGEKPSYASVTLEHLQAQSHSRQATITPAPENLALSDYSKTPSASVQDLPPPTTSLSSPKNEVLDSPTSVIHPLSSRSNPREGETSRERIRNDNSTSPPLARDDAPAGRFGPVGSPPRAGFANGSPSDGASSGRGALSSLFASLSMNPAPNPNPYTSPPPQHGAPVVTPQKDDMGPSSVTSQSSLHAHMNANILGTSPFSMPGSRSLFMPLSSSQTSQSNIPAYLAGGQGPLKVGVPASFAGSRAVGWGIGEGRRPSLPGHNARPSLGANSLRSGILDESAFEEENEDIEAEEFLPSSLSDLLTKEERERRFSRGGAIRPTKESLLPVEGLNTPTEEDDVWERTVRQRPNAQDKAPSDNAFSRSVPATNLIGQVRSLWDRDAGTAGTNAGLPGTSATGVSRVPPTGGITQDMFGGVSGSYGPSPSMLSSSVMSNASNAFLHSSRLGGDAQKPLVNDLQVGSFNPSSMLYQKQQQMSHAAHQHHSSLSGFPSGLGSRNGAQGVTSTAGGAYSMYSGPPDLTSENKSGLAAMYGQRPPQQMQPRPAMTTQNTSTHGRTGEAVTGLRHEPGQSLPRGLGAGLSRLHFVPAGSLGSAVGSPPPGAGFGSVASPPYGNYMNMAGAGRGEPNDLMVDGKFAAGDPKNNYGSGLTARMMAAGPGSQVPPNQATYQLDATQGNGRMGAMSIHNVRNQHSTWGSGNVIGQDDVDVDEGTLFNMD